MRLLAALVVLALLAGSAGASHQEQYARNPVEHDDQGRSVEPDLARTAVLGPVVINKVVDADLDGRATDDDALPRPFPGRSQVIAPGCTDDAGRQASGLCAASHLYCPPQTDSPLAPMLCRPTVTVQGMSGDAAPGAFTPTKASQVRFLDVQARVQAQAAGAAYLEVNRKLDDAAASLRMADSADAVLGPAAFQGWYGRWQDKNGNGVIDSRYDAPPGQFPPAPPDDEFVWFGNCRAFPDASSPGAVRAGFCALDAEAAAGGRTELVGFLFPGNHHGYCGGTLDPAFLTCNVMPADVPGRQAIHFLGQQGVPVCQYGGIGWPALFCPAPGEDLDAAAAQSFGDPLLDDQGRVAPDQTFNDRTGDPRLSVRQWVFGLGWATWFYDQSVLTRLVMVSGAGCPADAGANRVRLPDCRFADVDRYEAANPLVEQLLGGTVKPALRSAWTGAPDLADGLRHTLDASVNNPLTHPPQRGLLDDAAYDPGWSREPNDPGDAFPGAVFNAQGCRDPVALHHGWCNDYAAHRDAPHAYADVLAQRVGLAPRPIAFGGACILCVSGVWFSLGYAGEAPGSPVPLRGEGDHRRTLGAGQYFFPAAVGQWRDLSQRWEESLFDSFSLSTVHWTFTEPPDGWVGNVVNATGAWRYRGFADELCTTDQGRASWPYAWCHPYLDGIVQNPQQYGGPDPEHGEWTGRCDPREVRVVVAPADGRWDVPVFRWRDYWRSLDPFRLSGELESLEDHTATSRPVELRAGCSNFGVTFPLDLLVLPLGNLGETLTTSLTVRVAGETVTDVDTYHGWGVPR